LTFAPCGGDAGGQTHHFTPRFKTGGKLVFYQIPGLTCNTANLGPGAFWGDSRPAGTGEARCSSFCPASGRAVGLSSGGGGLYLRSQSGRKMKKKFSRIESIIPAMSPPRHLLAPLFIHLNPLRRGLTNFPCNLRAGFPFSFAMQIPPRDAVGRKRGLCPRFRAGF